MTNYEINILKSALLKVERKELNRFKSLPNENIELSEEFEKEIQKLAKKRKMLIWQATKTVPRRIAVVFAAVIITLCMMMSISAIRVPIINFFVNVYEEFISIFVEEDETIETPDSIEVIYQPSYIMDGYFEISSNKFETYVETIWMDSNGNVLIYTQDVLEDDYQTQIDNREVDYVDANFANDTVKYFSKNGQYFFVWTNQYYLFEFVCPSNVQLNEIENFINSLTVVPTDTNASS